MTWQGQAEVSPHLQARKIILLPVLQVRSLGWQPALGMGRGLRGKDTQQ